MMKLNVNETHDRLLEFNKQADYISEGCQDCIKNRPPEFGNYPFYIFAHKREIEKDERIGLFNQDLQNSLINLSHRRQYTSMKDVPSSRLIWSPRMTKPKAQTNSMLFKYNPQEDLIKIIWMIPAKELWSQYKKGNMTENKIVIESIYDFQNNLDKLESKEDDDLEESQVDRIYRQISLSNKPRSFY